MQTHDRKTLDGARWQEHRRIQMRQATEHSARTEAKSVLALCFVALACQCIFKKAMRTFFPVFRIARTKPYSLTPTPALKAH
jgi:hypothetical protein